MPAFAEKILAPSPKPPLPQTGRVVLIGGGEEDPEIARALVEMAGGSQAKVAIFPVGSPATGAAVGAAYQRFFSNLNCKQVDSVAVAERADASELGVVRAIAESDLLYFPSGNPYGIWSVLNDTALHGGIQAAWQRGAVIAGSGAGAVIWGSRMITKGKSDLAIMSGETPGNGGQPGFELKKGLELFEHQVFDTSFVKENRIGRMLLALGRTPDASGIGIDIQTAAVIGVESIQALGKGTVALFETASVEINNAKLVNRLTPLALSGMKMSVIHSGDVYDRKKKKIDFSSELPPRTFKGKAKPYLLAIGSSLPIDLPSIRDFLRVCGGNQSSILILSGEAAQEKARKWQSFLLLLGASQVSVLGATDFSDEGMAVNLQKATGIFLLDDGSGTLANALNAQKGRFGLYVYEYADRLPVAAAGKGVRLLGEAFIPEPLAIGATSGLKLLPGYVFENNVWGHNSLNRLFTGIFEAGRATGFGLNAFNSLTVTGGAATVVGKSPVLCLDADGVTGFKLSESAEHPPAFSNLTIDVVPPLAIFDLDKHAPRY